MTDASLSAAPSLLAAGQNEPSRHPSDADSFAASPPAESDALIRVVDVSKQFVRRSGQAGDLRERFAEWRARRQAPTGTGNRASNSFYALENVSFEVRRGQSVGIVGHNGSGKSTLLKLLTGILKPTSGVVNVTGRIGALIEVGAGFHPDLTGRENIYLNGSILGLSRREIDARIDRIIQFAGLEAFIDTPVKRYSSGMYMRLGFAVAAHTDPDVLLIDEVLAVGDMQFQRKCMRHLHEFVDRGGTLVFVSHGMDQMREICQTCVWLDHGQMRFVGPTEQAIEQYTRMVEEREDEEFRRSFPAEWEARQAEAEAERLHAQEEAQRAAADADAEADRLAQIEREKREAHLRRVQNPSLPCVLNVTLTDGDGRPCQEIASGDPLTVTVTCRLPTARKNLVVGVEVFRDDEWYVWGASNWQYHTPLPAPAGEAQVEFTWRAVGLNRGRYRVRVSLFPEPDSPGWDSAPQDVVEEAAHFAVTNSVASAGCVALPVTPWRVASPTTPADR